MQRIVPVVTGLFLSSILVLGASATSARADSCTDAGCVVVEGGCWCEVATGQSGAERCGYAAGYNGAYYSITGTASAEGCANPSLPTGSNVCPAVSGSANKDTALNIIAALGLTPNDTYCVNTALCNSDCATQRSSGGVWGTSLTCWDNVSRWNRVIEGIVRCVNLEDFGVCRDDLGICEADLAATDATLTVTQSALTQCSSDLAAAQAQLTDTDGDGEPDMLDDCPGTAAGAMVDASGCSAEQFCAAIGAAGKLGKKACKAADWQNDEPLAEKPKDCAFRKDPRRCSAK